MPLLKRNSERSPMAYCIHARFAYFFDAEVERINAVPLGALGQAILARALVALGRCSRRSILSTSEPSSVTLTCKRKRLAIGR
eukprot:5892724-Amphidinium_carterae.1